ncbi:MAG: hypothetical protein ABR608_07975 [Pseudonocardiaceae bacterium]
MGRRWCGIALLAVALAGLGAGCTGDRDADSPPPGPANLAFVDVEASRAVTDQITPAVARFFSYDFRRLDEHSLAIQESTTARYWSEIAPSLEIVRGVAPSKQTVASAEVIATSLRVLEPGRAELLLFVNRSTTEAGGPPQLEGSSVVVTAARIGPMWKIEGMRVW